jgi:hypothetical protein
MGSTTRTRIQHGGQESEAIRWRIWPLKDHAGRSWLLIAGMLAVGGIVWYLGGGWLLSVLAVFGLAGTLWQLLLPVDYEVDTLGLRRNALGRTRLIPWHAVRAFQLRPSGVVLYRHSDPMKIDVLRSLFVPYPADEDEMLCAVREQLRHAVELPQ